MAYAWLTSFIGYTLLCSLLGWTTRGRHHTSVSVCLTGWPLHRDFSLLFCEKWSGFFYVHRLWLSYMRDLWLKVSSERLGNEDKAPCQVLPRWDLNSCGTSTGISPCSFARSEVGSFTCIGYDSPIRGTYGLKSPPKDLAMRIKRLAKGRYCRGGIWTHAEPPVWKFAVYRLALRPLGHDSSSKKKSNDIQG